MSNVLAIAAVTQLLKDLVNDTLINGDASQILNSDFTVTALPLDRVISEDADQATQLNIFLFGVSPNPAYRNADLPHRSSDGELTRRPRLALNLHYLVTAISGSELHAEILLGYAAQLFHENGMLGRERIRAALEAVSFDDILPPEEFDPIRASEIAEQVETLKITPRTVTLDDMSKMWTSFQASYRTSVAYDVSLVLIERELPTRPSLPVLSRGGLRDTVSGRDPGVTVRPDLMPPVPVLIEVLPGDGHPVMRLGGTVELAGYGLDGGVAGAEVTVRFTEQGTGLVLSMSPDTPFAPHALRVRLPAAADLAPGSPSEGTVNDPASWRIGSYFIDVAVRKPDGREMVSNALPLALAPASLASVAPAGGGEFDVTLTCQPPIRPGQAIAVLAGADMAILASPPSPETSATGRFSGLSSGDRVPVRLRVDGIDSPVIDLTATPPELETVTIP